MSRLIRISSRKSALAKLQTYTVGEELKKIHPAIQIEYHFRDSTGDRDLESPLWKMKEKGVFTKDFREDLLSGAIDVVVHSYKDVELDNGSGTVIFSVLEREDPRDILLFKKTSLNRKTSELLIFSSSPRREYNAGRFLAKALPSRFRKIPLRFEPVRGNIHTRLSKWRESEADGILLAKAALDRLLLNQCKEEASLFIEAKEALRSFLDVSVYMCLPLSANPNAPGQGALAVEIREDNSEVISLLKSLTHADTDLAVLEERKILKQYGGGCHQKIGASIRRKEYGTVQSIKGLADSGEILDSNTLLRDSIATSESLQYWPISGKEFGFNRKPILGIAMPENHFFVTRKGAWPSYWKNPPLDRILWAAGVTTLYDLAAQDLWVHGTSDGLGEEEELNIDHLMKGDTHFIKLTHSESHSIESGFRRLVTYELEADSEIPDVGNFDLFYWKSGYLFDLVYEKNPEIQNKIHACGPGITFKHIRKRLGHQAKIYVFTDYESFKKEMAQRK